MSDNHKHKKRFGQNFLHDQNIIRKIVAAIYPKASDVMVEVGPGQAAITEPLMEKLDQLHVVELDRDLIPYLEEKFANKNLTIHHADALQFDFAQLIQDGKPLRIVGNLPYNISTPLIFHFLRYQQHIQDMHFMLQAEVVDRLAAKPGSKDYGRLSVVCQFYCQVDRLFYVPPGAFNPPPKVMSAIVKLVPRETLADVDTDLFEQTVKTSFAQRRKTLRNNLKQWLSQEQLATISLDLSLRPEQLSLDDYIQLSQEISQFNIHA